LKIATKRDLIYIVLILNQIQKGNNIILETVPFYILTSPDIKNMHANQKWDTHC